MGAQTESGSDSLGLVNRVDAARLHRLTGAVNAAAGIDVDASAESALVESYERVRAQAREIAGDLELTGEFEALFPEIKSVGPAPDHPRPAVQLPWEREASASANRASALLHELAGWTQGLIDHPGR